MKKVLIVTIHPLYPISNGGTVRVIELSKFLSRNGYEVHLIGQRTPERELQKIRQIINGKAYSFSWISYLSSGVFWKLGLFMLSWAHNPFLRHDLVKTVKKVRPDIIQCEFSYLGGIVQGISKKYGIPFVITEHNVEYKKLQFEGMRFIDQIRAMERDVCNGSDYLVAVSETDRDELQKIGVDKDICVIPNGVDYGKYCANKNDRDRLRSQYRIGKDDVVLLFHGAVAYKPNAVATDLIKSVIFEDIARRYPHVKLLLIGPGRANSIGDRIIEIPEVPFDQLPAYLSMGDIGIVPLTMGSGTRLKIIEYFSLSIPVVSTQIGAEGLPVTDNDNILIANDCGEDFIGKVERLINDRDYRDNVGRSGEGLAKNRLDWNILFSDYLHIYDKIL